MRDVYYIYMFHATDAGTGDCKAPMHLFVCNNCMATCGKLYLLASKPMYGEINKSAQKLHIALEHCLFLSIFDIDYARLL